MSNGSLVLVALLNASHLVEVVDILAINGLAIVVGHHDHALPGVRLNDHLVAVRGSIIGMRVVAHTERHRRLVGVNKDLGGLDVVLLRERQVTAAVVTEVVKVVLAAKGLGTTRAVIVVVGGETPLVLMEGRGEASREALAGSSGHTTLVSSNRGSEGEGNRGKSELEHLKRN